MLASSPPHPTIFLYSLIAQQTRSLLLDHSALFFSALQLCERGDYGVALVAANGVRDHLKLGALAKLLPVETERSLSDSRLFDEITGDTGKYADILVAAKKKSMKDVARSADAFHGDVCVRAKVAAGMNPIAAAADDVTAAGALQLIADVGRANVTGATGLDVKIARFILSSKVAVAAVRLCAQEWSRTGTGTFRGPSGDQEEEVCLLSRSMVPVLIAVVIAFEHIRGIGGTAASLLTADMHAGAVALLLELELTAAQRASAGAAVAATTYATPEVQCANAVLRCLVGSCDTLELLPTDGKQLVRVITDVLTPRVIGSLMDSRPQGAQQFVATKALKSPEQWCAANVVLRVAPAAHAQRRHIVAQDLLLSSGNLAAEASAAAPAIVALAASEASDASAEGGASAAASSGSFATPANDPLAAHAASASSGSIAHDASKTTADEKDMNELGEQLLAEIMKLSTTASSPLSHRTWFYKALCNTTQRQECAFEMAGTPAPPGASPIVHCIRRGTDTDSGAITYVFDAKDAGVCWEAGAAWAAMLLAVKAAAATTPAVR